MSFWYGLPGRAILLHSEIPTTSVNVHFSPLPVTSTCLLPFGAQVAILPDDY